MAAGRAKWRAWEQPGHSIRGTGLQVPSCHSLDVGPFTDPFLGFLCFITCQMGGATSHSGCEVGPMCNICHPCIPCTCERASRQPRCTEPSCTATRGCSKMKSPEAVCLSLFSASSLALPLPASSVGGARGGQQGCSLTTECPSEENRSAAQRAGSLGGPTSNCRNALSWRGEGPGMAGPETPLSCSPQLLGLT